MPKKTPQTNYIETPDGAADYRSISKIMTELGFTLNPATARNQTMKAINEFLLKTSGSIGGCYNSSQLENLLKTQGFHDFFADILYQAASEEDLEKLSAVSMPVKQPKPYTKPVICIELKTGTQREFHSITEAAKHYKLSQSSIHSNLRGKTATVHFGKYRFVRPE